jgi:hypothetical protein
LRADHQTVDRGQILIHVQGRRFTRHNRALTQAQGVTVSRSQVQLAQRTDRNMLQHPVDRDVDRVFWRPVWMRRAKAYALVNVKKFMAERRINLEKNGLTLGFEFVAGRIVLAELFRREHRGDQRFGNQRKVQMNGHGNALSRVWEWIE